MNKLNKTQRQRNYFNSIEKIKKKLNANPESIKPYSRRTEKERLARDAAQKEYNEQQRAIATAKWKAEGIQLRKELDKLFEPRLELEAE